LLVVRAAVAAATAQPHLRVALARWVKGIMGRNRETLRQVVVVAVRVLLAALGTQALEVQVALALKAA
jgi:hypothetical protein